MTEKSPQSVLPIEAPDTLPYASVSDADEVPRWALPLLICWALLGGLSGLAAGVKFLDFERGLNAPPTPLEIDYFVTAARGFGSLLLVGIALTMRRRAPGMPRIAALVAVLLVVACEPATLLAEMILMPDDFGPATYPFWIGALTANVAGGIFAPLAVSFALAGKKDSCLIAMKLVTVAFAGAFCLIGWTKLRGWDAEPMIDQAFMLALIASGGVFGAGACSGLRPLWVAGAALTSGVAAWSAVQSVVLFSGHLSADAVVQSSANLINLVAPLFSHFFIFPTIWLVLYRYAGPLRSGAWGRRLDPGPASP